MQAFKRNLSEYSASKNKKIICIEYGYCIADNAVSEQWLIESKSLEE